MRSLVSVALLGGCLILSGCLFRKHRPPEKSPTPPATMTTNAPNAERSLIVSPETGLSGKIAWADSNLRFVVLSFPVGRMPSVDQRFDVYRQGLKVGEVKISGPQTDENTVADIVTGDAQPGDTARQQ